MLKKRIAKIIFVLACIITLIMPYTTPVFAAKLTKDDTKANLKSSPSHEGGEEATGKLTEEQKKFYDETSYGYQLADKRVFKVVVREEGKLDFSNAFYCLNAVKSFPAEKNGVDYLEYTKVADLKDSTDSNVKSLHLSTSNSADSAKWTSNYKAVIWLADNVFLKKEVPEQKDDFLAKAFADYKDAELDVVKAVLTDDDIDVVQQYAIWYFTNNDDERFNVKTLPAIRVSDPLTNPNTFVALPDKVEKGALRQDLANHLYQYLITSAEKQTSDGDVTYPSIEDTNITSTTSDEYYIAGPFKVKSGTAKASEYKIELLDQDDKVISRDNYKIRNRRRW